MDNITLGIKFSFIVKPCINRIGLWRSGVIIAGLLPIMWGTGTGSQAMKRIAAPMVGGMISSTLLTLLLIPAIYVIWKSFSLEKEKE